MRERALKILLLLVGLLFLAAIYPIAMFLLQPGHEESSLPMMLSLYATLGVFLLLAARNPSAHRTLIAFAGWANVAHAAVMVVQSFQVTGERAHLLGGVAMFGVIGIVLIVLAPGRQSADEAATSRAWAA
jgi:hypothetical protein